MTAATLAQEIGRIARNDGDYQTAIPQLMMARRSGRTEPLDCMYMLGLAVVAQGSKRVTLNDQVVNYAPGQSLLVTVDLPVVSQVTQADLAQPFLGLLVKLDMRALVQLAADMELPPLPRDQAALGLSLAAMEEPLLDAVIRLVRLLQEPQHTERLAPLIQQEIMVRLLTGPHGPYLRHLIAAGSPCHQVAQAIAWLKTHFSRDVLMDELAERAHMSPSTFRQHFRGLTGMSPLQYQKQLRLQEARQLMLTQALDASSTAARVGYESVSQFNREYSRQFGAPPQRDIKRMRELPGGGVVQALG